MNPIDHESLIRIDLEGGCKELVITTRQGRWPWSPRKLRTILMIIGTQDYIIHTLDLFKRDPTLEVYGWRIGTGNIKTITALTGTVETLRDLLGVPRQSPS